MNVMTDEKPPISIADAQLTPGADTVDISSEIVMLAEPDGGRAEAVRVLRNQIVSQHLSKGRRAVAVCAASADVGCSFVAANLAVALSQIGLNTLLIDADLRHPTIDRLISPPRAGPGLGQCLAAPGTPFGDYLHPQVLDNLSVMYAGPPEPGAQELIGNDRFETLIQACSRDFDVTVVDTPPANSGSAARRISTVVGYGLVVARSNRSLVEDVKTLVSELAVSHCEVVGTVLNEA